MVAHAAALVGQRLTVRGERRRDAGARPERPHVVRGPVLLVAREAVAVDVRVDEPRVAGRHRLVVEPRPREGARASVGDEDVGAIDEVGGDRTSLLGGQVQRDAALVAVVELERRVDLQVRHRQDGAERVAIGRLDLDDVGSPVAEDACGGRSGHPHPHLDDPDPFHRSRHAPHPRTVARGRDADGPRATGSRPARWRSGPPAVEDVSARCGVVRRRPLRRISQPATSSTTTEPMMAPMMPPRSNTSSSPMPMIRKNA